jgi:hypothetical protein
VVYVRGEERRGEAITLLQRQLEREGAIWAWWWPPPPLLGSRGRSVSVVAVEGVKRGRSTEMAANKGMVAGSHNRNEFVMIRHDGDAPAAVRARLRNSVSSHAVRAGVGGSGPPVVVCNARFPC